MDIFYAREPVCTWSHAAWLLLSIPGTILLLSQSRRDPAKRVSLLIFGLSLAFCYACSTLYHGLRLPKNKLAEFDTLDHTGIFIFIAGSYTPIAVGLLKGVWRNVILEAAWAMAAVGTILLLIMGHLPKAVDTSIYMVMGWGAVLCLHELAKILPQKNLLWLVMGGVLYTIGAVFNLMDWPTLYRGVFGPHELFHFFTMAGTFCHFWFMLKVVVPYQANQPIPAPVQVATSRAVGVASGRLGLSLVRGDSGPMPRAR